MTGRPAEQTPTHLRVGPCPSPISLLHTYDGGIVLDVASELAMTAETLKETATASIHNDEDMIRSAVALRMRLRSLAAAVIAERGETR